ncbi:MAG: NIPSNAP family protein [Gemmatimonadaceae bacterium]
MTSAPLGRRELLTRAGALIAGAATSAALAGTRELVAQQAAPAQPAARELYELRTYRTTNGPRAAALGDYFRDALVPALRRHGTGPVGVFTVAIGEASPSYHVLIPHASAESLVRVAERLAGDAEYRRAGAAVTDAPASAPAYDRMESALFLAFAGMPRLELPPQTAAGKRRLFELRRYEALTEVASQTKIGMFDQAEIAIFRRAGMHPVFFGQALVGASQPNLTYLLAYDDMADHDVQWGRFGSDPEWKALSSRPEFADAKVVSSISNLFLRPTAYSQI